MKKNTRTVEVESQRRNLSVRPKTIDEENRTVELVFSSGYRGTRFPFFSEPYDEELSLEPGHVRLDRLNNGGPFLDQHGQSFGKGVRNRIGVTSDARVDGKIGTVKVRYSKRADADEIFRDVVDGILTDHSVGYRVYKYEDVTEPDSPRKILRAVDWEPFEVSAVDVPFDPDAKARSNSQEKNECEVILRNQAEEETIMPEIKKTEPKKEDPIKEPTVDAEALKRQATEDERLRVREITKLVDKARLGKDFADELVDKGISLDKARSMIIDKWSDEQKVETRSSINVQAGAQDESKTRMEGAENALLNRFDSSKFQIDEKGKKYRGMSLIRLCEEFTGKIFGTKSSLAARALSSSDFPHVLANVANKSLTAGYAIQPRKFQPLVRETELPDYKEVTRVKFGDAPSLQEVKQGAEYTFGKIGDSSEKYKLAKYGKIMPITEEVLINDDLDAFSRMPFLFGSASFRLESKLVWGVFLNNPIMGDGKALFHADHGNLAGSGTGITDAGLNAAKKAIRDQKSHDGEDALDLEPANLICGTAKEVEAKKLLASVAIMRAAKSSDVNVHADSMDLIVVPNITDNQWFVSIGSNQGDVIELGYLDGMRGPQLTSKEGFEMDGVLLKVKHVVAAKAIDWKGLYKNPGA